MQSLKNILIIWTIRIMYTAPRVVRHFFQLMIKWLSWAKHKDLGSELNLDIKTRKIILLTKKKLSTWGKLMTIILKIGNNFEGGIAIKKDKRWEKGKKRGGKGKKRED